MDKRLAFNKKVVVTTSWDDGHPHDLRLASLLAEFGIRGTFYVATHNTRKPVMGPRDLQDLNQAFEIGSHTASHQSLPGLSARSLKEEVLGGKIILEDILGKSVPLFCYPWGKYDRRVRQAVIDAGFVGARTTREFYLRPVSDLLQMPTTLQAFPHSFRTRIQHGTATGNWRGLAKISQIGLGKNWVQLACKFFDEALTRGGVWHLWGHSWEIEDHSLWGDLKMVLGAVARHPRVTYLTNGEVIESISAARRNDVGLCGEL